MFSLVTFARRPLTIGEISEAVTILRSPSGRLEEAHKPYLPKLLDLLPPLLEVHGGSDSTIGEDATDDVRTLLSKTCRLYHSTVFDYLRRKAKIICESEDNAEEPSPSGSDFRVCPLRIADACLRYLTQVRYSKLLQRRQDIWVDADGQSVSAEAAERTFLTYSAKNWDKHADLIVPDNCPSSSSSDRAITRVVKHFNRCVQDFLTSPNFQTCIQVQSLCIVAAFGRYRWTVDSNDGKVWFRRCLPHLILNDKDEYSNDCDYHRDYQRFWGDWRKFLACTADCDDDWCPFRKCGKGEVDRCWWGALGPDNFLSTMESRYRSFRLEVPRDKAEATRASSISRCFFQTTLPTHDRVFTARLA